MTRVINVFRQHTALIFVFIVGFSSVFSLLNSGLPPTHDGEYHVVRFYEFNETLGHGDLYPVWASNLNYTFGSPLFNYVYPLPNYMSSLFHLLGFSFIDAFKLNLITASIVGAIASYLYGKERFGKWGGVIVSVFYTYAPYHFLDIYIRGSVGEVWALALFPLGLLTLDNVASKKNPVFILLSGIVYSLIIFSHNILAVMYTGFIVTYIILLVITQKEKINVLKRILSGLILGILLSTIFFLPALIEKKYVVGLDVFSVFGNFPDLFQLLIPSWGSGFSGGTLNNQMSFQIGIANLLVVFIAVIGIFLKKFKQQRIYITFFLLWFFTLVFLMLPVSELIWRNISFMQNFQFPWRFLSILILCCAILAGSISYQFKSRIFYVVLILLAIISANSYAKAPYFIQRNDEYYTANENFIYGTNSIANGFQTIWLSQQKKLPQSPANYPTKVIYMSPTRRIFDINTNKKQRIIFNISYFPGWNAYLNTKKQHVINSNGLLAVDVGGGKQRIELSFRDTPVRFISKTISIITFIIIVAIFLKTAVIQLKHENSNR